MATFADLFRRDGVHLSKQGNQMLLDDLQQGLPITLSCPVGQGPKQKLGPWCGRRDREFEWFGEHLLTSSAGARRMLGTVVDFLRNPCKDPFLMLYGLG